MNMHWTKSLFLMGISATGAACGQQAEPPVVEAPKAEAASCPSDAYVGAVHGGLFYLEHGSIYDAREALERAESESANPDATGRQLLASLHSATAAVDADPDAARLELEHLRVALVSWPCLHEHLHAALHEDLPPIPGAAAH